MKLGHGPAGLLSLSLLMFAASNVSVAAEDEIALLAPSFDVTFWTYVADGVEAAAKARGMSVKRLDSENRNEVQLQNARLALSEVPKGIILSPTNSSSAKEVLDLAEQAQVPVVVADIGSTGGNFVSFVGSDNYRGARGIGRVMGSALMERGWTNGSYGIIGIPQQRINGLLRTNGFRDAMHEFGVVNEVPMRQMQTFTPEESFRFAEEMMSAHPDLRAIFVQSDVQAIGVHQALEGQGKEHDILVAAFDGTPELVEKIKDGDILGTGMQQPYLLGKTAMELLARSLEGEVVEREVMLPVLVGTSDNIEGMLDEINLNVFAGKLVQ